jgi:hypothetical protein
VAGRHEQELWKRTTVEGWSDSVELGGELNDIMLVAASRSGGILFLAEHHGEAIAAAALDIEGDIALLAGASTIPRARKLGAQASLLGERLRYAAHAGCELAMMGAEPGSASQRNAERQGFRIAYTRTKWRLCDAAGASQEVP